MPVYDWTNKFNSNKIEWLQFGVESQLNHLLIICHRPEDMEEKKTAKFQKKWNKVKFTFMRIKNVDDAYTAFDDVWLKNEYSNIIFSDCHRDKCRYCENGMSFKKQLRKHSLIEQDGSHYFHTRNVFFKNSQPVSKLVYSKFVTSGSGWYKFVIRMVQEGMIQNSPNTKLLVLSGGHGEPDGSSCFDTQSLVFRRFFYSDKTTADELKNPKKSPSTDKIRVDVVDITTFHGNVDKLIQFINAENFNFVVLAWCHSFYSNLKQEMNKKGVQYPVTTSCILVHQNLRCPGCKIKLEAKKRMKTSPEDG